MNPVTAAIGHCFLTMVDAQCHHEELDEWVKHMDELLIKNLDSPGTIPLSSQLLFPCNGPDSQDAKGIAQHRFEDLRDAYPYLLRHNTFLSCNMYDNRPLDEETKKEDDFEIYVVEEIRSSVVFVITFLPIK